MSSFFDDDNERTPQRANNSGLHALNRFLIGFILLGVTIVGGILFVPVIRQYREQQREIVRLQKDLARDKALYAWRLREEQLLKNDPAYIEMIARDKLDVMKPGETIIRINSPTPTPSPAPTAASRGRTR